MAGQAAWLTQLVPPTTRDVVGPRILLHALLMWSFKSSGLLLIKIAFCASRHALLLCCFNEYPPLTITR